MILAIGELSTVDQRKGLAHLSLTSSTVSLGHHSGWGASLWVIEGGGWWVQVSSWLLVGGYVGMSVGIAITW